MKKPDDGPGGRCTHQGCRRKATEWNNIGPETGDPVCVVHWEKRPRKPKPLFIGSAQVAWISGPAISFGIIGCYDPQYARRLSAWLARAADWMEAQS